MSAGRLRGGGDRERRADEVLDDPVVQVGRDPAPFDVGGVDRPFEETLALGLGALQPAAEPPSEPEVHRLHHPERTGDDREELGLDPVGRLVDPGDGEVRLVQERCAPRTIDREVDLEEAASIGLESVLRTFEVADLRDDRARPQRLVLLLAEGVRLTDQGRFVRVDDRARRVPQLHPHRRGIDDARRHDAVECADRRRVTVGAAPGDRLGATTVLATTCVIARTSAIASVSPARSDATRLPAPIATIPTSPAIANERSGLVRRSRSRRALADGAMW